MDIKMEIREDEEEEIPVNFVDCSSEFICNQAPMLIDDKKAALAEVIIEELNENDVTNMDVNMEEFIDAVPLGIEPIEESNLTFKDLEIQSSEDDDDNHHVVDIENHQIHEPNILLEMQEETSSDEQEDTVLTNEDKSDLIRQFLVGEVNFSEYSLRMGKNTAPEVIDTPEPNISSPPRDIQEDYEDEEIEEQKPFHKKIKRTKSISVKRLHKHLPPALVGLMGEANTEYASGKMELAEKMCLTIIKEAPNAPEPYETLGLIYERLNKPEKSLQYLLIGAFLSPLKEADWCRLAKLSVHPGNNIKQAITCYSKAIQANPKDASLYEARAELQERLGEKRAYIKGYLKLIHRLGPEDAELLLRWGTELAQKFFEEKNYDKALITMEQIFKKCTILITAEEVNMMTALLIITNKFERSLDILTTYTTIWVDYEDSNETDNKKNINKKIISNCGIPEGLVVDLRAKFLVTLIELDNVDLANTFTPRFLEESPEESGDLFLDIAEAFMRKKKYQYALKYLDPLVKTKKYSMAAVWLRYAECWLGCKQPKRALLCYEIVNKLSPGHLDIMVQLSTLYKCFGFHDMALKVLQQDPNADELEPDAVYREGMILLKMKDYEGFIRATMLLMSSHCIKVRARRELVMLTRPDIRHRLEALRNHRLARAESFHDEDRPRFKESSVPSLDEEFNMFLELCKLLYKFKRFSTLQRVCFTALTSKKFEPKTAHIIFTAILSCIYNNDAYHGYNLIRDLVRYCPKPSLWNLLNIIIQKSNDSRHNRFIMRLLSQEDAFSYLHVLHANNCLVSGTYKYALNEYVSLFKVQPSALLSFLISLAFLQMACQKFTAKKHRLICQAIAFLKKYEELRGSDMSQEIYYNIARSLHQIGLLSGASQFYKLVLEETPSKLIQDNSELLDLKKEAAYNLHLIYMQSGNPDLATIYLNQYIVV